MFNSALLHSDDTTRNAAVLRLRKKTRYYQTNLVNIFFINRPSATESTICRQVASEYQAKSPAPARHKSRAKQPQTAPTPTPSFSAPTNPLYPFLMCHPRHPFPHSANLKRFAVHAPRGVAAPLTDTRNPRSGLIENSLAPTRTCGKGV